MGNTETLTSLAMLKIQIDQGFDYLDYLRPFVLQILFDKRPDPINDQAICNFIREQFGLEIPPRAIQIVLKRLARKHPLEKVSGLYRITGPISNPGILSKKSEAERHIVAVINGLINFAKEKKQITLDKEEAVSAICSFLSEFNISCIQAYLQGTTIPLLNDPSQGQIVLISDYVLYLQNNDPDRFNSFLVMLQGHMLANALLCPDLHSAPRTYKEVTFFLDTPLLIQCLELDGRLKRNSIIEMIELLQHLGATIATFSHSREELIGVLKGAAEYIDSPKARSPIVWEARRNGRTKSDILLIIGKIDQLLKEAKIEVKDTPAYMESFQIDETVFSTVLDEELKYGNPRAKDYDINSVRSIYVLRGSLRTDALEKCKATLVTSNGAFAKAAFDYERQHNSDSNNPSSVITDFSLTNMAWLKAPMGAPSIPTTVLLAYSYAALKPSATMLEKFLKEVDKLQNEGKLSAQDHQILRSSTIAQDELMQLTLGEENALNEEMISQTLERTTHAIKSEEVQNLRMEQEKHQHTQEKLYEALAEKEKFQKRVYWRCQRRAKFGAWAISGLMFIFLGLGIAEGLGMQTQALWVGNVMMFGAGTLLLLTIANLIFGTTVKKCHTFIENKIFTYLLRKEARDADIDFGVGN